jgi:hypothetical protein
MALLLNFFDDLRKVFDELENFLVGSDDSLELAVVEIFKADVSDKENG